MLLYHRKTQVGGIRFQGPLQRFSGPSRMAWLAALCYWSHRGPGKSKHPIQNIHVKHQKHMPTFFSFLMYTIFIYGRYSRTLVTLKNGFFVAASDAETKKVWVGSQRELHWGRWGAYLPFQRTCLEPWPERLDQVSILATNQDLKFFFFMKENSSANLACDVLATSWLQFIFIKLSNNFSELNALFVFV